VLVDQPLKPLLKRWFRELSPLKGSTPETKRGKGLELLEMSIEFFQSFSPTTTNWQNFNSTVIKVWLKKKSVGNLAISIIFCQHMNVR
ncbi:hypothetical protein, partial [Microcoleus sp. CAWBG640]|uniref:hypothetical protein n=1 Tax=Microcoleus sp. CAWBG640 TaxID=2841653 RepID=UPI00312BB730